MARCHLTTNLLSWDDPLAHCSETGLPNVDSSLHYFNVLRLNPFTSFPPPKLYVLINRPASNWQCIRKQSFCIRTVHSLCLICLSYLFPFSFVGLCVLFCSFDAWPCLMQSSMSKLGNHWKEGNVHSLYIFTGWEDGADTSKGHWYAVTYTQIKDSPNTCMCLYKHTYLYVCIHICTYVSMFVCKCDFLFKKRQKRIHCLMVIVLNVSH